MDGIPITIHHVLLNPNPIHAKFQYMLNIVIGIVFSEMRFKCNFLLNLINKAGEKHYKCCFCEKSLRYSEVVVKFIYTET